MVAVLEPDGDVGPVADPATGFAGGAVVGEERFPIVPKWVLDAAQRCWHQGKSPARLLMSRGRRLTVGRLRERLK
jgi:hypothetical protein